MALEQEVPYLNGCIDYLECTVSQRCWQMERYKPIRTEGGHRVNLSRQAQPSAGSVLRRAQATLSP
jgi:hypothetical protein